MDTIAVERQQRIKSHCRIPQPKTHAPCWQNHKICNPWLAFPETCSTKSQPEDANWLWACKQTLPLLKRLAAASCQLLETNIPNMQIGICKRPCIIALQELDTWVSGFRFQVYLTGSSSDESYALRKTRHKDWLRRCGQKNWISETPPIGNSCVVTSDREPVWFSM